MTEPVIPPGSVIVTPDDMWETIREIQTTGHRTESAINDLRLTVNPELHNLRQDEDATMQRVTALEREMPRNGEARITALEQHSWASRWLPTGVSAVLTAALTGLIMYGIGQWITHG